MQVYYSIQEFKTLSNAVVTTGTFDGVHFGHKKILKRINRIAKMTNGESVLLTFNPHPRHVLQPDADVKMLTTLEEKIELLRKTGLQHLIIHPFTREFSRMSSLDFVRKLLAEKLGVKKLVIGYDHHFGRNREGSFEHLKEYGPLYGFEVEEIPAQELDDVAVSSTKIRKAVAEGQIEQANEWLGYVYQLQGKVVHGQKKGHELGFPTANVLVENIHKLIPGDGVYAVEVSLRNEEKTGLIRGMCNIGKRPTMGDGFRTIEVHLFDFDHTIYGEMLCIRFLKRLRNEQKFASLDELRNQLHNDRVASLHFFENQ